jgi:hypothetical protein
VAAYSWSDTSTWRSIAALASSGQLSRAGEVQQSGRVSPHPNLSAGLPFIIREYEKPHPLPVMQVNGPMCSYPSEKTPTPSNDKY